MISLLIAGIFMDYTFINIISFIKHKVNMPSSQGHRLSNILYIYIYILLLTIALTVGLSDLGGGFHQVRGREVAMITYLECEPLGKNASDLPVLMTSWLILP
jgi:hypothetical protein